MLSVDLLVIGWGKAGKSLAAKASVAPFITREARGPSLASSSGRFGLLKYAKISKRLRSWLASTGSMNAGNATWQSGDT